MQPEMKCNLYYLLANSKSAKGDDLMQKLLRFLSNPHKTGLYVKTYKLELDKLGDFNEYAYNLRFSRKRDSDFIQRLFDRDKSDQKRFLRARMDISISHIVRDACMHDKLKPKICDFFRIKPEDLKEVLDEATKAPSSFGFRRLVRGGFLRSRIYPEHFELLHIDFKMSPRKKMIMIELTSLKEIGLRLFDDLISCLPIISDSLVEISNRQSHSERYIFKLYSMGVKLWVNEEDKFLLNENIKNFINASIRYYELKEWRTSIVLSSIAVESIFAELFEEGYKKSAPDIPLGGLIKQVEEKISLPVGLSKKISALNKARIASVHRSENPVSDKDSIISMMGATSLIMWYFDNY